MNGQCCSSNASLEQTVSVTLALELMDTIDVMKIITYFKLSPYHLITLYPNTIRSPLYMPFSSHYA